MTCIERKKTSRLEYSGRHLWFNRRVVCIYQQSSMVFGMGMAAVGGHHDYDDQHNAAAG
ncbi:hypothetical protein AA0312_2962 [Acetobacter tropicalis NRIC 0312]|uniref:Uncharacterized protein n=1 Tax=Acetobacter tropicalis TaxID=104102 RepID=A0A511FSQ0_9PROT|nr:hypothetical protein [Acetobacter tropicalis]GAL98617.1 hypothetical protein ATR1_384d0001 [Acetobacter tropicalis]GBR72658.1 hypothetical protein AA0312_2962 [Acetobacter tropicalis NRIC 0312]GEL51981.1 hypothetical protein ATR01nite_30560 [Acetobacter tropicalis]